MPPDQQTGVSRRGGDGHIMYIPIPPDVTRGDVARAAEPLKERLRELAADSLAARQKTPEEAAKVDKVIIFTDHEGSPILPDREAALGGATAPSTADTNELKFTFNSPAYPWSPEELAKLKKALGDFYPVAESVYGPPAFNITVNVSKNPTIGYAGFYGSTANEIVIRDITYDLSAVCHEMLHAFRDDNILSLDSYEEGMVRAAEVEVFNRLDGYTHWDENHGYNYDVTYEGLDRQVNGFARGGFYNGYASPLLGYQLAGYAWSKALIESPTFLKKFNRQLYQKILSDPTTTYEESRLWEVTAAVEPKVEGRPFLGWYARQSVFNTAPPAGYFLYQRFSYDVKTYSWGTAFTPHYVVDYFYRYDYGAEVMQPGAAIRWEVYNHKGEFLDGGFTVTTDNGWASFSPSLPDGYVGRVKVVTRADGPGGRVENTSYWFAGSGGEVGKGIFGIVPRSNSGTLTVTYLDGPNPPVRLRVSGGAFAEPALGSLKGRFLAVFQRPDGRVVSRRFTKDAGSYYLVMSDPEEALPPAADAYVREADPDANFGGDTVLLSKMSALPGDDQVSYLKFDLGGTGGVGNAKLRLYGRRDAGAEDILTSVYPVADTSWPEDGITWDNKPAPGTSPLKAVRVDSAEGEWYEWDVSNYVLAQRAAKLRLIGLALKIRAASLFPAVFNSRESVEGGPRIVLDSPARLGSLTLSPDLVLGGSAVNGRVMLGNPAPAGGTVVFLSSSDPAVAWIGDAYGNPINRISVPKAAKGAEFRIFVPSSPSDGCHLINVTITAAAEGASRSATLTVVPAEEEP